MSNHFQILLEVPPMPEGGISDQELLERLGVFYSKVQMTEIVKEMEAAAAVRMRGRDSGRSARTGHERCVAAAAARKVSCGACETCA